MSGSKEVVNRSWSQSKAHCAWSQGLIPPLPDSRGELVLFVLDRYNGDNRHFPRNIGPIQEQPNG
jgi:hypothetical protein